MPQYVCSDEDFHTAMLMTDVLLEHSLLLSTSVQKSETNSKPLKPYFRLRPVLQSFSGTFTFAEMVEKAVKMGIPQSTAKRLFKKTVDLELVVKEDGNIVRLTASGRNDACRVSLEPLNLLKRIGGRRMYEKTLKPFLKRLKSFY